MITFELRPKVTDTGGTTQALVKLNPEATKPGEREEEWCTLDELNRLFDACMARWPMGWDLEKLITAVRECEFD